MYLTWCDVILVYVVLILQAIYLLLDVSYEIGFILRALTAFVVAYFVSGLIERYERIRYIREIEKSMSEEYKKKVRKSYEEFLKKHPNMRKKEDDEDDQN